MKLVIKKTTADDLENILGLWNSGEVMKYVGFPEGLNYDMDQMKKWLDYINENSNSRHYSIYEAELGYCGETFYEVDSMHDVAALDIKLLPQAQGRNIAYSALKNTIRTVFGQNLASKVYVDPHPDNQKAWKLYARLGFKDVPRPLYLEPFPTYLELNKSDFERLDQ
jgi:RimJ/RimL family protein N-acetyltransferase